MPVATRELALAVLALAVLAACPNEVSVTATFTGVDTGSTSDAGSTGGTEGTTAPTCDGTCARSCGELLADMPGASDGPYTLYVDNDPSRPWEAWCVDMAGTPMEYLILPMAGPDTNFSEYEPGQAQAPGTTVRTTYTRVRVDPQTLLVDISDQTFATSTGQVMQGDIAVTSMPYAVAMDCYSNAFTSGRGNVDLRGTPFTVWASQWVPHASAWNVVGSADNQVMDFSVGGMCGHIQPRIWYDEPDGPINDWGGFYLQLAYKP